MRILVTGGAGFVGSHLVAKLVELGETVRVLDSLEEQVHGGAPVSLPDAAELVVGDVGDPDVVDRALDGVDRVVHLAAVVGVGQSMYEIERYVRKNTLATAIFLERLVARRRQIVRHVVASSMSIYGEGSYVCDVHDRVAPSPRSHEQFSAGEWECRCPHCGQPVRPVGTSEDKPLQPTSVYAVTKRDHEELALAIGAAYGMPTVALRFFNIYGQGQALSNPYTGVAAIFASRLLNGNAPIIFEDGQQSRDFIHVSDIVNGLILALTSESAVGRALNLGTGTPSTVNDIAAVLAKGLGLDLDPEATQQFRVGDIRHCYADVDAARRYLGFEAAMSLEAGMMNLLAWLQDKSPQDRSDQAQQELIARGLL